jgi:hypothetical protein
LQVHGSVLSPYCEQALRAEPTGTASRRSNPTVAL